MILHTLWCWLFLCLLCSNYYINALRMGVYGSHMARLANQSKTLAPAHGGSALEEKRALHLEVSSAILGVSVVSP